MELSAIWYIAAVIANGAVIVVTLYLALLCTIYWSIKIAELRAAKTRDIERIKHLTGGR